ncbi:Interleukin-2 receptor subunit alpha [Myotis brandtii]|uniref:Interleukin-2 receptor subunit alpha n=1 Tax=Myotis brandtii TaxID=109478 RepID=S7PGH3_MYOBR|nr:Interleukin-2 receptor subunit alpha [Myotis brandtii]
MRFLSHNLEFCYPSPPNLRHATFKVISYEMGTLINCDCKKGFRRSSKTIFMNCTGNAGYSAWENQCQCKMNCHCREPPRWEHEASKRTYHFVVGQTVHYECAQGFRAKQKGPATSTCKMICGKTRWTQPQLKCTSESENDQFLGDEEFPAITDIPSGSEASCPFTTTSITTGMARICFYEDKSHYIKWERGKTVCLEQPRQQGQSCSMDVKMIKIRIRPPNPQRLENKCQKEAIPY